jgi:uncharacterized 2Fe-2S/4Fe-4S cluster protein (DUF4445 family)
MYSAPATVEAGYRLQYHFDTNWPPMLPCLKDLPAKSGYLHLDERTDNVEAKRVLGAHLCLFGNLKPSLFHFGTEEEVERRVEEIIDGSELIHIEPGDTTEHLYGVAVDLGSTGIAAYLVAPTSGETVGAQGTMNPQLACGEDIATRLSHAVVHANSASQLQRLVVDAIGDLIHTLCEGNDLPPDGVLEIVLGGEIHLSTIGGAEPAGRCGSGILDCVAGMVRAGLLNPRDHIQRDARSVRIDDAGPPELVLTNTRAGHTITITQTDVERI